MGLWFVGEQSLLGSKAHAEAGQVSVGKGEKNHEDDVPGIMAEPHCLGNHTRLDITEHEEGDEDDPQAHEDRKPDAVLARLERDKHKEYWLFVRQKNIWRDLFGIQKLALDKIQCKRRHECNK